MNHRGRRGTHLPPPRHRRRPHRCRLASPAAARGPSPRSFDVSSSGTIFEAATDRQPATGLSPHSQLITTHFGPHGVMMSSATLISGSAQNASRSEGVRDGIGNLIKEKMTKTPVLTAAYVIQIRSLTKNGS